jgi:hypothetical protein
MQRIIRGQSAAGRCPPRPKSALGWRCRWLSGPGLLYLGKLDRLPPPDLVHRGNLDLPIDPAAPKTPWGKLIFIIEGATKRHDGLQCTSRTFAADSCGRPQAWKDKRW